MNAYTLVKANEIHSYDFTADQNKAYQKATVGGNNAQADLGSANFGMWAGDARPDTLVYYEEALNDRQKILDIVGDTTVSAIPSGYRQEDLNLDGYTRYMGKENDKIVIYNTLSGNVGDTYRSHIPE